MKIGFIGLGIMGRPMALNLKNAGHELTVPDRPSLTNEIRVRRPGRQDAEGGRSRVRGADPDGPRHPRCRGCAVR